MSREENPRLAPNSCRATTIGGLGIEWVCVKETHAKIYKRRSSDRNHRKGDVIFESNKSVDSHYFVPRWLTPAENLEPVKEPI